ncbi:hypothetical protein Fmac_011367 [Flemingia macrophylla]|uniref:Bromo domain-containing protein n=1 Tax=Flemingia macrophylla TaxID=520843 RepID=A0ABD1MM83_9FABA
MPNSPADYHKSKCQSRHRNYRDTFPSGKHFNKGYRQPCQSPSHFASATSRLLFPSRASSPLSRRDRHLRVTATATLESHLERHSHSDVGDSVNLCRFTPRDREADRRRRRSLNSHPREPPGETLPQRRWRQRKDTHGVFSEPVDPEELPDYHDIIKQPMDYGTVRKKLDKGLYPDLEQFEVGVAIFWNRFLACDLLMVVRSEATSCPGGSESTSVDPINEEKLLGSALRLGDAFPNLSSGRSTQESEKILQLEQQVRQSREEARQSREEARQSREQNERLQRQFESLFNAVLPLLPSDTQQLLQQQTNIQDDNEDDQQPSSAAGHYGNDY